MPTLARALLGRPGHVRTLAGAGLIITAATVLLAQSRVVLLLALLLLVAWVVWSQRTLAAGRREAALPVLVWVVGGLLLFLVVRAFDPWLAVAAAVAVLVFLPELIRMGLSRFRLWSGTGESPAVSRRALIAAALVTLAALAVVAPLALPDPSDQGVQRAQGLDHGRVDLWMTSLDKAAEKPFLGYGQGSFLEATVDEQESPVRFAHNLIIESAVELGLLGALLASVVMVGSLAFSWRWRNEPTAWLFIPMVVGYCALALVDWTWYLSGVGAVWAICLGCILSPGSPKPVAGSRASSGHRLLEVS
jgi:O-antigen ligase